MQADAHRYQDQDVDVVVSDDTGRVSHKADKMSLVTSVNPLFDPVSIYECDLDDDDDGDDCIPLL